MLGGIIFWMPMVWLLISQMHGRFVSCDLSPSNFDENCIMGKSDSESKKDSLVGWLRTCKRWSPVFPIYGAFWGMGIGLGCGVGWGPGFGPNVVGYAGGGCGLGFNVGVTVIGFGVGVPETGLTCLPYNLFLWTSKQSRQRVARHVIPALILGAQQCWNAMGFRTIAMKRDLLNFSERVYVPKCRKLCNNLQKSVIKGVQKINARKRFTSGKLSYRLEMKELRVLQEVTKHIPSEEVAVPQDKQDTPAQISLEYVVHP